MNNLDKIQVERISGIDVVLKISERCNLACPYCYYYFQEFDGNKNKAIIADDVVEALPAFFERTAEETLINHFRIVLHGGEPLMLRKSKFDWLITTIKEKTPEHITLGFGIQTNAVLIDEEWIELFEKHQIRVGISLDGTEKTHGKMRPKHNGESSYPEVVRGLKLVQEAYKEGRIPKIGALALMHPEDGKNVLTHLIDELGITSPGLNFPRAGWGDPEAKEWISHLETHRETIKYWIEHLCYPHFYHIRGISTTFLELLSDEAMMLAELNNAVRHHVVTVSSEGDILVDDNLFGLDESLFTTELNVFDHSLKDFLESDVFKELTLANDTKPMGCEGCQWYRVCKSGPLYNRFSKVSRFSNKASICDFLKMVFEELTKFALKQKLIEPNEFEAMLAKPISIKSSDIRRKLLKRESFERREIISVKEVAASEV